MKKFISLILIIVLTFSFSACGGKNNQEEETTVPAIEFPLSELFDAYLSDNGAVYNDFVNNIKAGKIKYSVEVYSVEDTTRISCVKHDVPLHILNKGFEMGWIEVVTTYEQTDLLKTLKKGDIIEFEGYLDFIGKYEDIRTIRMAFRFDEAIIKSVNGTAV